jgi:hypothetical protein
MAEQQRSTILKSVLIVAFARVERLEHVAFTNGALVLKVMRLVKKKRMFEIVNSHANRKENKMASYKQLYDTVVKKNRLMMLCWKCRDIPLFANIIDQLIEGEIKEATIDVLDDVIITLANDIDILQKNIDESKEKFDGLIYADDDPTADEIFEAREKYKALKASLEDKRAILSSYERISDLATSFMET